MMRCHCKECTLAAELDALDPGWRALPAMDTFALEEKLRSQKAMASPKRRLSALARKASEIKLAGKVSSALQSAKKKLSVARGVLKVLDSRPQKEETAHVHAETAARSQDHALTQLAGMKDVLRDHSMSLAVIEQVLDLSEEALSMAKVTHIVKTCFLSAAAPVSALAPEETRVFGNDKAQGRSGTADSIPGGFFDDEDERQKREELQPRLVRFWRRLKRRETGRHMSGKKRRDMAALTKLLWTPWKLDRSAVQASPGFDFLGGGTFGVVTKGTLALKCCKVNVTVKVMQMALSQCEFKADFFSEAFMLHRLRHPAIVTFYGAWWPDEEVSPGSDGGSATGSDDTDADADADASSDSESSGDGGSWPEDSAAFVMERMDGHIGELVDCGKISAREDLWSIFVDAAQGLLHLHEHGVMHLDVKPENVLASVAGDTSARGLVGRAKITNFGVVRREQTSEASRCARASQRQRRTRGTESGVGVVGTMAFMAPEILLQSDRPREEAANDAGAGVGAKVQAQRESSRAALSFACDVYSLGLTMCRVMQLHMARAGKRVALPATFVGSEGDLTDAAQSEALAADVEWWVREVLWEDAEMALRQLVLACVQTRPCDRPPMAAVLVELQEMKSSHGVPLGKEIGDIYRAVDSSEMNARSVLALGVAYRDGTGVTRDVYKAFTLISRSADMGNVAALVCLASRYASGVGAAKDYVKARELYQRAAAGGDMRAVYQLGVLHEYGIGVAEDCAKARELYQRAADGGKMTAVISSGVMYFVGKGVAKDFARARELFQRAANGGDILAVTYLGLMYENGNGVAQDFGKARELYERAADDGNMAAVNNLGSMYENGNGVAQDFGKARELYQRAADGGNMNAVCNLGVMYDNGNGVTTDYAKACELYQRAAEGGSVIAAQFFSRRKLSFS